MSPLSIITGGWLSPSTEQALTIMTMGWLSGSLIEPIVPHYSPLINNEIKESGGGSSYDRIKEMRGREEDEIYNILKMWTQCQG